MYIYVEYIYINGAIGQSRLQKKLFELYRGRWLTSL
jgi:hypothetical protein